MSDKRKNGKPRLKLTTMPKPTPTYRCHKCGKESWANGGRPVCYYCQTPAKVQGPD